MSQPQMRPKVDYLEDETKNLKGDMSEVKERLTRVESAVHSTEKKVDDIHKWAGWFFKTIVGAILTTCVGIIINLLL